MTSSSPGFLFAQEAWLPRRAETPTRQRQQSTPFPKRLDSTPSRRGIDRENPRPDQPSTVAIWQPRTPRRLTDEDARQITENVVGFFQRLLAWDAAERSVQPPQQFTGTPGKRL